MNKMRKLVMTGAASIAEKVATNQQYQSTIFNSLRLNRAEIRGFVGKIELRFLAYCLARRERSRSQILQDLWVCFELGEMVEGFFVEFGATDGVKNSNTWLLENELDWTGILAEPNPLWHGALTANRDAAIERRCVSSRSGDVVTFITTNDSDPELSGIAEFAGGDRFAETRSRGDRIQVETISLDDLLDQYRAPPVIDYLSIDTEGSELEILSAYSFNRAFRTISVESNPKNERAIEELLSRKGYIRVFKTFSQWDSWYVSADLRNGRDFSVVAPDA